MTAPRIPINPHTRREREAIIRFASFWRGFVVGLVVAALWVGLT